MDIKDWERDINPITLKLMRIMRDFHKLNWGGERTDSALGGCKPSEVRILFCIRHGKMKVSEISKLLHVTSPSVTQLLKGLETNGLIVRQMDPVDRRSVDVSLTKKGDFVIAQALKRYRSSLDGLVEYLGEDDSEKLVELIEKVLRYYGEREARYESGQEENV